MFSSSPTARLGRAGAAVIALSATLFTFGQSAHAAPPLQTCQPAAERATQRHWFFGNRGYIDFGTSGTSGALSLGPAINSQEGTTVVSDTSGALQFWSNGLQIFDRDGNVMDNGAGLLGNASSTQTVAAFPAANTPGKYFVVTTNGLSDTTNPGELYYSVVDMNGNGGLGTVTSKNNLLGNLGTTGEALTAVPNDDGTGFWVLTYSWDQPNLLAYEFDSNGPVTGNAVESTFPTNNAHGGFGSISVSPDLSKLVVMTGAANSDAKLRLLSFDGGSGVATQNAEWQTGTGGIGNSGYYADFSPSGKYVYATRIFGNGHLLRYDVSTANDAAAIKASQLDVGVIGGNGGSVRRAPDGRMYVANSGGVTLSVVNDPDNASDVQFVAGGVPLPAGAVSRFGLPQTVTGCPVPLDPPVAVVDGPTNGAHIPQGGTATGTFHCEAGSKPITSCTAKVTLPDGSVVTLQPGDPLPTGLTGDYTIEVTATDSSGATSTGTSTYTVVGPPTVTPGGPADGTVFEPGTHPGPANFSCSGGEAPVTCTATVTYPDGHTVTLHPGDPLPDDVPGGYTITVTGTDGLGQTTTKTSTYTVRALNALCRATTVQLLNTRLISANDPETPCKTASTLLLGVNQSFGDPVQSTVLQPVASLLGALLKPVTQILYNTVNANAGEAYTRAGGPTTAAAQQKVASVSVNVVNLVKLNVTGLATDAVATLSSCSSTSSGGYSTVAAVTVNNKVVASGDKPVTVPLGIGTLYVNQVVRSATGTDVRGVFLDLPGTALDVVIGESKVGASCA